MRVVDALQTDSDPSHGKRIRQWHSIQDKFVDRRWVQDNGITDNRYLDRNSNNETQLYFVQVVMAVQPHPSSERKKSRRVPPLACHDVKIHLDILTTVYTLDK